MKEATATINEDHKTFDDNEKMKVISFVIPQPKPDHELLKIEYPELDSLLNSGYEIVDTIPSYGSGNYYFVTFVLRTKREKYIRHAVGFNLNNGEAK